ncbi:uncharacterized protein LOC111706049 [Eurytemora carolleeae]|uniref:uncharacterized protein LOC111706049 n=1 Tax=Eurytemora carolleeae TaxID=1294199 RepID=UPI000C772F45|nr:uncharacterized protein LOC111706049 [Eurytemora carolleeae]|eukprot:XP_023334572.1 uncharacterized protein LOC111706049 [Eurytemora affinis]
MNFSQVFLLLWMVGGQGVYPKASPWDWQNSRAEYPVFQTYQTSSSYTRNPEFLEQETNVTSHLGGTAQLPCTVKNLGLLYTVTWMRGKDVTILSVGHHTFNTDNRISVVQVPGSNPSLTDWILQISNLGEGDQGVYECQVNTDPKIQKVINLSITDKLSELEFESDETSSVTVLPRTTFYPQGVDLQISGPKIQYTSKGGNLNFACTLTSRDGQAGMIPTILKWKKDGKELSARVRSGLSLETEKLPGVSRVRLYIESVTSADAGEYTCISDITRPASVQLLVSKEGLDVPSELISGEKSANQLTTIWTLMAAILLQ